MNCDPAINKQGQRIIFSRKRQGTSVNQYETEKHLGFFRIHNWILGKIIQNALNKVSKTMTLLRQYLCHIQYLRSSILHFLTEIKAYSVQFCISNNRRDI